MDAPSSSASSDAMLRSTSQAISETRAALSQVDEEIQHCAANPTEHHRGYVDLVASIFLSGTVDVHYRGRYLSIPFAELASWLLDPTMKAARFFGVDRSIFLAWADLPEPSGFGQAFMTCAHGDCKLTKGISFDSPTDMETAKSLASEARWYCHHHRLLAWTVNQLLADNATFTLIAIARSPGCNRQQLGAPKEQTDFLASVGLLRQTQPPEPRKRRTHAFYLTEAGEQYVASLPKSKWQVIGDKKR